MSDNKLTALRDHPFGTGIRVKGEEYTANDQESEILKALGWAEDVKDKPVPAEKDLKADGPHGYKTRDLKAGK